MAKSIHPAARILLACGWAVAVESAAPSALMILAVAPATAFVFAPVRTQLLRLLRRTRWLLAVLLLTYAYTLPGVPAWPALGWASPSLDGLLLGTLRVARVVLLLGGVALLLASTPQQRLIYGLYVLAKPLARLGFDRRALAVRLGLTLDYVEHSAKPARWLDALRTPPADAAGPAAYSLQAERWRSRDSAFILLGFLLIGAVLA